MAAMKKGWLKKALAHIDELTGAFFLCIVVFFTALNVILRYCFDNIIVEAEELILIAFIWSTYIGITCSYKHDQHVVIDVLVKALPKGVQKVLDILVDILLLVTNLYVAYLGVQLCANVGNKSTFVMRLPYVFIDCAIVFSFGLMSIYSVQKLWQKIKGFHQEAEGGEQ